jgi:uncharacterized protein (TIGR03067 family)
LEARAGGCQIGDEHAMFRKYAAVLLFCVVILLIGYPGKSAENAQRGRQEADQATGDAALVQGDWNAVEFWSGSKKTMVAGARFTLRLRGGPTVFVDQDDEAVDGRRTHFSIDAAHSPKHFDVVVEECIRSMSHEPPLEVRRYMGICKTEGNRLVVCFRNQSGLARPVSFEPPKPTAENPYQYTIVLERVNQPDGTRKGSVSKKLK